MHKWRCYGSVYFLTQTRFESNSNLNLGYHMSLKDVKYSQKGYFCDALLELGRNHPRSLYERSDFLPNISLCFTAEIKSVWNEIKVSK